MGLKYAFMSFSCPDYTLDEMLAAAKKYGYRGLEPRVGSGHKHGIEPGIDMQQCQVIKRKFAENQIEICCVATSCKFADPQTVRQNIEVAASCLELAAALGSPAIRVFGGALPAGVTREQASDLLFTALSELAPRAQELGVTICVETHDDWCNPTDVAQVMEKVNHPNIAINWDVMHPVRKEGLTIDESFAIVKRWMKHVHIHDGSAVSEKLQFMPIGEGIIDHKRVAALLTEANYQGFISGEWINWEPADVHLPREIAKMKEYERTSSVRSHT